MLAPAHVGHQAFIRALIRESAAQGNFDRELATDSPAATAFFADLRQALHSGYLVELDRPSGESRQLHVAGYVYQLPHATAPIGFGLFKQFRGTSFELWLIGIDALHRRRGHGRAMIHALLSTPAGQLTHLARINRGGLCSEVAARLLGECGFVPHRTTPAQLWLVHPDAAPDLIEGIAGMRVAPPIASD